MHCHSTWSSDGKNTLEEMALAAKSRGLPVPLHHRPLALPPRRAARGAVEGDRRAQRAAEVVSRAPRDRGEHPRRRLARRRRRHARRARLGHRVAPHVVRPQPDRADPRRDGQPARRLHRPPHGSTPAQARRSPGRRRARRRARRRDRDGARDQLAAGSARHARHARTARRRGGRADPDHDGRALGRRARLRGARRRAGAARMADEGAGAEHALAGARSRS